MDKEACTEYSVPALVEAAPDFTVTKLLDARAAEHPDRPYCEHKDVQGAWQPITLSQWRDLVRAAAKGLMSLGVSRGDAVGLQANTRYEWALLDMAIMAAGAMTVPIYPSSSPSQVEWSANDAALSVIIVETAKQAATAKTATPEAHVVVLDDSSAGLESLIARGAGISDEDLDARTKGQHLDEIASIVYTSGTTGNPKGVELTHRNLVEHALNAAAYPHLQEVTHPGSRLLLFLPLAHVLARHLEILSLASGMTIGFAPSPATLPSDLKSFAPNWMIAVPRVLETFYHTAESRSGKGLKRRIFQWAATVSRASAKARQEGRFAPHLALALPVADKLVLGKVRAAMGGQMRFIVCGGARLSTHFGYFYTGLGVKVLEGYGLTESSAPTTCNPQSGFVMGTVGKPLPGCSVRIAPDGEIELKGSNIFAGYRHDPQLTASVLRDGWFATGDLGSLSADGFLTITGRKKEILVLDSGKNVQPAGLEDSLRADAIVQEAVVIGDGKSFVAALISLDEAMLGHWLSRHGLERMSVETASVHPEVIAYVKTLVNSANSRVSHVEAIRKFRILPRPLSEAHGEFSASLKVRRAIVMENFATQVDDIYGAANGS